VSYKFRCVLLAILALGATALSAAQVSTGAPPFSSTSGGPFDSTNAGNLNVHFAVPIVQKAGRGMSFSYSLSYDSSVWTPATVNGVKQWQPAFNWGWTAQSVAPTGYLTYMLFHQKCDDLSGHQSTEYRSWAYHDQWGIVHTFGVGVNARLVYDPYNCAFPPGTIGSLTKTATDNSGITLNATLVGQGLGIHTLTMTDGTVLNPPLNLTGGYSGSSASVTDANGNQLSVSSTSNSATFTDTLGTTALTVSGTSPVTFTYTSPAGSAHYTLNYVQYTVQTAFSVSGVNEYGRLSNALVDNIQLPDGSKYSFTYEQTPVSCTPLSGTYSSYCVTGRIASVTLPAGGKISYTYSGGSNNRGIYSDGSTAGLTRVLSPATSCASGGCWQYTRALVTGTIGPGSTWTTTITDPPGNQTVVNLAEDSNTTAPTYNFIETQRRVYQGTSSSGTLLSTAINCYNGTTPPTTCATTTVGTPITRTTQYRYLPDSSGVQAETDTTMDSFGLTDEVDEYDYAVGAVGSLIRKTITTYYALGNGIVDRPSTVTVKDANDNIKATTSYFYDETAPTQTTGTPQHISVAGARGLLTKVMAEARQGTWLYRKYTYYDTGNLKTSTDVSTSSTTDGATTTYTYGSGISCGNSFVTSISEPLSLSRSMTWDCNGAVMLSLTDENGKTSSTGYSGSNYTNYFWRPYSSTDQAGTVTDYWYYLNASNQQFQSESKYHTAFNGGTSTVDVLTTNDEFGRTIFRQTKQGPNESNYDTIATCYDSSGHENLATLPYATTAITSSTLACPTGNSGTSYTYDAMNRTLSVSDSGGGSTTYSYTRNDTVQTLSTPTQKKQLEYDALGRLASVCEVTNGTTAFPKGTCVQNGSPQSMGYWTTYTYDPLGNLTGVTQNAQASSGHQTRMYAYDMLGRLTSETNPETNNAAVTYSYDWLTGDASCGSITSAGNMVKRLDAAQNAACYSDYDALHRVGTTVYPSSSTPAKHFVYDNATVSGTAMSNAKTRLAEAYTCTGTCTSKITDLGFSYAATGQTTDVWELTPHSGTNYYYRVTSNLWPNGVMNTLQNLSGLPTITYSVDGEGRLGTVSTPNLVSSVSYDPAGHVTGLTYGSSDSDSFQFYPTTGRPYTYQFSVGATPTTNTGVLTWNTNGTLQQLAITDNVNPSNSQTCNYTHDDLGRVASANCGSSIWSQTFGYDPFGNITKTVPPGATGMSFEVNYDYTNNTNRITTVPYSYTSTSDPNAKTGNLTADDHHAYSWDTDGHVVSIDSGSSSGVCLVYDALGRAVEKQTGSSCTTTTTEIVYGPAGNKLALMNGASLVKAFVPLPGGAQAVYNSSGLQYYRHPDWLGSSRMATTPSRSSYYDVAYAPYGEPYLATGTQDLSFTGQNQDTESSTVPGGAGGLYDFLYRKHSPVQGRWLSPDPAGLAATSPADPQTWNRYAYVTNRSLNNVDPLGLFGAGEPPPGCDIVGDCECPYPELCPIDPVDPIYPPSGGGIVMVTAGAPRQRTGGVWPGDQTTGLPPGLNTSPLSTLQSLLGLLPGIACRGMGGGSGFIGATPAPSDPCPPDFGQFPKDMNSQRTQHDTTGNCTADTLPGGDSNLCQGWPTDATFTCGSDKPNSTECCNRKENDFSRWCNSRNSKPLKGDSDFQFWWVKDDFWPWRDACCKKARSKGKGK